MLVTALKAEVDAYVAAHAEERDEEGHALVVRNGVAQPRKVTAAAVFKADREPGRIRLWPASPTAVGEIAARVALGNRDWVLSEVATRF